MRISKPIIIAHKGASGHAPENTILSYQRALELGAQMIELDVHETLDGQLVCIHDSSIDRTTDGSGFVNSFTYTELLGLDAGGGERIPLLEDVLKFAHGSLQVNIELKMAGVEQKVLEIIERQKMVQNIIISSFLHDTLATIRELSPSTKTAILTSKPMNDLVTYALDYKANAINPHFLLITPELVHEAHGAHLLVYPWTVNDKEIMKELFVVGVDGLITDFPERAADVLRTLI